MKISQINTAGNSRTNKKIVQNNKQYNKNQNFGGIVDSFALGTANLIENGGLFISFTLQDMLGTNLPRPIMGLFRNSKETGGQINTKFAAKEIVREMLTGPSMFIIPWTMLKVAKVTPLGKTIDTPMAQIKALSQIHAENPLNSMGNAISKQEFFQSTFAEMIKNAKNEKTLGAETIEKAREFAKKLLTEAVDDESTKATISNLSDDFINIAKQHSLKPAHTNFTNATIKNSTMSFNDVVKNMMAYADDVVEKVSSTDKSKLAGKINKIANTKIFSRLGMNAAMFVAVITFLRIIPKLYNKAEGAENAGLVGLMNNETLNDNSLNAINNNNKGKSNPSFGSLSSATTKVANKLAGNGSIGKALGALEFEGMNLSFPLLLATMGIGVLIPRLQQAKDEYDKEEILRRDVTTCATMCFAEKALRKGFSKLSEATSGLVVATKPPKYNSQSFGSKIFQYLRPINGVNTLTSKEIVSKYSGIDKYKNGILGFCDFIIGQNGNLSKVFSLTDESKVIVQDILGDKMPLSNADNLTIKTALEKAKDSDKVKKLIDLFKDKNNPWVTKAKTMNARFTAFSVLLLVPLFLGFMLPWINERATKKRIKKEQELNENEQSIQPKVEIKKTAPIRKVEEKNIFADMSKLLS